jgi:hypothetical protein
VPSQRVEVDRDHQVGEFAGDRGPGRGGQPLPAHLAERVGPPLRGGAQIRSSAGACLRVGHRSERGDQGLPGLRVQIAVHAHHPAPGGGDEQTPPLEPTVLVLQRPLAIGGDSPGGDHVAELAHAHRSGGLHERVLDLRERLGARLARRGEQPNRVGRDLARRERVPRARHPLERPRVTYLRGGSRVRPSMALCEPRRDGQAPVRRERAPPLELDQPPRPFRLEHARGAFELVEVGRQAVVVHGPKVLEPQLVQRRSQGAHDLLTLSNTCSDVCEPGHTRTDL